MISRLSNSAIDPVVWDAFILASPQGSMYATHAYASAISEDWEALILDEGNGWNAVLPFIRSKKYGLSYLLQPPLCQTWGPILEPNHGKNNYKHFSHIQRLLEALAEMIPFAHLTQINCHASLQYLLPFYEKGFKAEVRYTHQLAIEAEESLRAGLSSQAKRKLRKSDKADHKIVDGSLESLLAIIRNNQQQGHDIMGGLKQGGPLLTAVSQLPYVMIKSLENAGGNVVATGMFAMWNKTTYYLAGAQEPSSNDDGAMYRLLWEGMMEGKKRGSTRFDFEGSMIPGVARFFRQFGSEPVPYFSLIKNRLPLPLRWMRA